MEPGRQPNKHDGRPKDPTEGALRERDGGWQRRRRERRRGQEAKCSCGTLPLMDGSCRSVADGVPHFPTCNPGSPETSDTRLTTAPRQLSVAQSYFISPTRPPSSVPEYLPMVCCTGHPLFSAVPTRFVSLPHPHQCPHPFSSRYQCLREASCGIAMVSHKKLSATL